MGRKDQIWWVSATVLSLGAFSFFAGLGMRGLYGRLTRGDQANGLLGYPQVASAAPQVEPGSVQPQLTFYEVLRKLRLYYVEPLPSNTTLSFGSVDAMLNSLNDPNTRLLTKTEVDALRSEGEGVFPGLGAVLTIDRYNGQEGSDVEDEDAPAPQKGKPGAPAANTPPPGVRTITVVAVAPGSPAEKAGLQPLDRITEIDGRWIAPTHVSYRVLTQLTDDLGPQDGRPRDPEEPADNRPPDPAREKLKKEAEAARNRWKNATELPTVLPRLLAEDNAEHELTIERGHPAKTLKVKVRLGQTKVDLVDSRKLNDSTGYLRIFSFGGDARQQAEAALREFAGAGVKNLVVDLRESPGGSLETARDVAGLILGEAKFAVLNERGEDRKMVNRAVNSRGPAIFKPAAISVLVDGGTAGTSELFAAALREQANAKLIGANTFGDGTEQEIVPLENGAGVSLTRAKMLTSRGTAYDGKGLKPDAPAAGDPVDAAVKSLSSNLPARAAGKGA